MGPREMQPVARSSVRARAWARSAARGIRGQVDQLVLEQTLVDDGEPAGLHEPP